MARAQPNLIERVSSGESSALNELVSVLYDDLRRIASYRLRRERDGHTLQATALVHEAYLKIAGGHPRSFSDRAHFLSIASSAMRQVLVDWARARGTRKRSPLETARSANGGKPVELLDLDAALSALVAEDRGLAGLLEMKYFGAMTAEEIAEVRGVSVHVVRHDLRLARAWLRRRLSQPRDRDRV